MQDAPIKEKQQIVDKINSVTNILITVSRNPSVDDLSAALGLTMLLNKVGKHATAIFSGAIPPAITFLEPDKVFEDTIDSLRDFIIALDKEKADHLRYKVDGDVVKIFITPYRAVITDKDLQFSQGDYNVELVLALGVENQEHLDLALAAHGQILHDVAVMTLSSGKQISRLGSLDWYDPASSCLCEMVTSLSDLLKTDQPLLDKQISTALLTGIVAATERFSNNKTSASTMTLAAQLMAAGADQQLIASKLQEMHQINSLANVPTTTTETGDIASTSTLPSDILSIDHISDEAVPEIAPQQTDEPTIISTLSPEEPQIILDSRSNAISDETADLPGLNISGLNVNQSIVPEPEVSSPDADLEANALDHIAPVISQPVSTAQPVGARLLDILDNDNKTSTLPPEDSGAVALEAARGVATPMAEVLAPVVTTLPVDLPLPPPIPNNYASNMSSVPDFGAMVSSDQPTPPTINNDPAQFRIPGQ